MTTVKTISLENVPLFAGLSKETLAPLVASCRHLTLERDEFLFRQGDKGKEMFIIESGQLLIWKESRKGQKITLVTLGSSEVVGELEIIDGKVRSANAQAIEQTQLVALARDAFFNHLGFHPGMAVHMMTLLSGRIRHGNELYLQLHQTFNPTARLARLLLSTALDSEGNIIKRRHSLSEIAYILGLEFEALERIIMPWLKNGMLEVADEKWLIVLNAEGLKPKADTGRLPDMPAG